MEQLIAENSTLALLAVLLPAILAALPGIYNIWRQRKKTDAEQVKTEADAAKVIGDAYVQLQAQYKEMMNILKVSYDECTTRMEVLAQENAELKLKIDCLEKKIEILENGGSHAVRS